MDKTNYLNTKFNAPTIGQTRFLLDKIKELDPTFDEEKHYKAFRNLPLNHHKRALALAFNRKLDDLKKFYYAK